MRPVFLDRLIPDAVSTETTPELQTYGAVRSPAYFVPEIDRCYRSRPLERKTAEIRNMLHRNQPYSFLNFSTAVLPGLVEPVSQLDTVAEDTLISSASSD